MNNDILIELYKSKSKMIYRYLIKRGCSKEEAEDIMQDSFVKAIEYIDIVDIQKFHSWLFTVSINNYNNYIKRKNIIKEINLEDKFFYNIVKDKNNVEETIIQEVDSIKIKEILNNLKEIYKTLLILKYDMDLSYKEIGEILDMKENTVKIYLYRARNKFKKIWRDKNEK
ncbi:MAG: RNA polymerase sigma factor [Senegalia sp. (in: firmicutes)]|uniref:RNA polymerase sigma factor n=2 Tax=Senegalia sp. (in: firmicutes) TaxID=1924098 RepID=UPI003F9AD431